MHIRSLLLSCLLLLSLLFATVPTQAVEVAPRITDREIVERLTRLEEGQKNLDKRLSDMQAFNEQRFTSIDQRFTDMHNTMLALFGSLIAMIIALFGYIAWDRRTMFKPLIARLERIERDLERDLELGHNQGSRLTRLVVMLREMAKTDPKIAEALRSCSLL
ncbi:hypothetical protein [Desulfonatronum thioautotrophicum]|uniref:hypothetical protein n=1 Tax=Desulfonatronum thioautotrophicum TaxID=617001 RepID=UPI0005EAE46E|nr:hypothetical protein [Desulfonatronum thioautotrophicum]